MIKIRCVVERITYQNPENGYSVLKCAVKNYGELVTVVGNLVDVNVGSVLLIDGDWKVDVRYGRQFLAERWEETMPATVFGIEKYLGSGLIKGVGPKYAKKIVQQFGTETLEVIETDVKRLMEVSGIGKKRVDMIAQSWERQKEIKNVMLFLQDHGVSTAFAAKIYRQYGNESIAKIKENPFRLADDIWGIGFKTADSIAGKLGIGKEAFVRLRSGIMYTLGELADDGHVYAEQEQLIRKAAELLEAEDTCIIMTMDQMFKDTDLIREKMLVPQFAPGEEVPEDAANEIEKECIYLPPFYYAEIGVANKLKRLAAEPAADRLWVSLMKAREDTGNPELSISVDKIRKTVNMEYDEVQAEAIRRAATAKVLVLTGGPGTGKTTTTQGIIAAYRTFGLKILLAAPTGRAAKRMTEATGLEAKTIHRLLEYKPPEGYQKNEEAPLEGDVLIVDECSMIDVVLMNALMKAIPSHMRLILVGDIDQLPSVGAGNVLRDIIDSEVFPVVRLTRIFRQAQSSRIIMNAHRINEGQMPDTSNGKNTDFFFMTQEDPEGAVKEIVELVQKKLPIYYKTPASQIQVLTPMQKGVIGATNLNMALQEALNPQGEGLRRSGFVYRPDDKVMQIKNNYDKEVFNGDIGIIESVDLQDRTLTVNFDGRSIEYDATELDELVHAYATTIHKAQGSEYPIVVMPMLMNHYVMLQRNLIYTGITRAKKILVMVGTKKALSCAVRNVTVTKRNTLLKERLANTLENSTQENRIMKKNCEEYVDIENGYTEKNRIEKECIEQKISGINDSGIKNSRKSSSGKKKMGRIVVIDTETTWTDAVMSIGAVIADAADYSVIDSRYYLLTPECRQGGMYSDVLKIAGTPKEICGSRAMVMADLRSWLDQNGVEAIFAYNAKFDKCHMPEFINYDWFDIMRLAAYRQYNRKIPADAQCCKSGRLKNGFGVEAMYRLLSGENDYSEKHNGWYDAIDELKLMEMLGQPLKKYEIARI